MTEVLAHRSLSVVVPLYDEERVVVVNLRHNFGQTAAMSAGFDVVSGWRANRTGDLLRRKVPSQLANWLIGRVTGVRLHDYGCALKAYRAEWLKSLRLYGEMHRFIPALASWSGAKVTEIPVNHRARKHGRSKYGMSRTIRVVLDLITVKFILPYSTRPLQIIRMGLPGGVADPDVPRVSRQTDLRGPQRPSRSQSRSPLGGDGW